MPSVTHPRRLATSAQVYPNIFPYMHATPRHHISRIPSLRRLPMVAAAACICYAAGAYEVYRIQNSAEDMRDSHLPREKLAMLEAYGGRDTLEELETATRIYESQDNKGH